MALRKMFRHEFPTVASTETVATARGWMWSTQFCAAGTPFMAPKPVFYSETAECQSRNLTEWVTDQAANHN